MILHVIFFTKPIFVKILLCLAIVVFHAASGQQKEVAITIDDVPNVMLYKRHGFSSPLLKSINELSLPVTIFINEKNIYNNEFPTQNFKGLITWLNNSFIHSGNHSFSHLNLRRYPTRGLSVRYYQRRSYRQRNFKTKASSAYVLPVSI